MNNDLWETKPIEDCFAPLEDGRTLHQGWSPQCEKGPSANDQVWGVLKTTAIQSGTFKPEHNKALPNSLEPRPHLEVKEGDILLTCAGPRIRCGVACLVRGTRPRLMISGKMYRFRVDPGRIDPRYVESFLQSKDAQMAIDEMKTGISESGLNLTHNRFRKLPIRIAPIQEQRHIVEEIEIQFTRLDAGVGALRRVQAKLKKYRAAVLKAACEGRLVPTEAEQAKKEGRPNETGSQLLARILAERRKKWQGRSQYKDPATPNISTLPPLPEGWAWGCLEQISWDSSYGTSEKCSYEDSGLPVIRIPNISGGRIDLTDLKFTKRSRRINEGDTLAPGDLLIIRTNGSKSLIGRSAIIREKPILPTTYASYLIRFRLYPDPIFFGWIGSIWNSSFVRAWIEQRAATSAGQHNISMSVLNTLPIPVPPLVEQTRIVAEVERRLSVAEELESVINANLQRAQSLRQSILGQAFSGKLITAKTSRFSETK